MGGPGGTSHPRHTHIKRQIAVAEDASEGTVPLWITVVRTRCNPGKGPSGKVSDVGWPTYERIEDAQKFGGVIRLPL